jgi:hypothetical protein
MPNFSYKLILLSGLLTFSCTLGGWALTDQLAGEQAGHDFLIVGAAVVVALLLLQSAFYLPGRNRLIYQLRFAVTCTLPPVWLMLCLLLPTYWLQTIRGDIKTLTAAAVVVLCVVNFRKGVREFDGKWSDNGRESFGTLYDSGKSALDWSRVVQPMRLEAVLYVPGIPSKAVPILSMLMVVFMLLGLGLRKVFPEFSMFAWGIPCGIAMSVLVQMAGMGVAQVSKIKELEKMIGKKIRPPGEAPRQ